MLNEKANKFLYWNGPFYFRLFSLLIGEGYYVSIPFSFLVIVKDSPFCRGCAFSIANNVGDSEILVR